MHGDSVRKAKREQSFLQERNLPHLWIIASSASETLLNGFGASSNEDWGRGVYFLPPLFRTEIVAINQLPCNEETLWLRLLGKGQTQNQAVSEVIAFDTRDPRRSAILRLLTNWKISIELTGQDEADEELVMVLTQAYLEWEQQTEQTGIMKGEQALILRQLSHRIGEMTPEVRSQIQALSLAQLELLGEALLDFSEPGDLVKWLNKDFYE